MMLLYVKQSLVLFLCWIGFSAAQTTFTPLRTEIFQGDTFQIFNDLVTNDVAKAECISQGGSLARVASSAEHTFISDLRLSSGITTEFWVGVDALADQVSTGTARFSYTDGSTENLDFIRTAVGAFPWFAGEPNDSQGEDCVE